MSEYTKKSFTHELAEISLNISQLHCSCFVWMIPRKKLLGGLIRFSGTYRHGSSGSDDAMFIRWRINEFCDLQMPDRVAGLVVDLTDLDYQWGDDLDVYPVRLRRLGAPVRVVVAAQRLEAFEGVLGSEELRTELDAALQDVTNQLRSAS
jgi:hypothetical protein